MTTTSNTGGNRQDKGQFKKGDARINRKGRPKSFDALRALAQAISHERSGALAKDGHELTVAEAIMRQWAQSKNPQLQRAFIEVAFGKVPDVHELTGKDGKPLTIIVEWDAPEGGAG